MFNLEGNQSELASQDNNTLKAYKLKLHRHKLDVYMCYW